MYIDQLLRRKQAVVTDRHFVYTGEAHGDGYANCRFLGESGYAEDLRNIAYELLRKSIQIAGIDLAKPIALVGPETLGAKMVRFAMEEHNRRHTTRIRHGIFDAVKGANGVKTFRWSTENPRIEQVCAGAQIIWMDDLLNAGSTFERTRPFIEHFGQLRAIAVIVDRSGLTANDLGVSHIVFHVRYQMARYPADDCPLCRNKVPIVRKPGHGAEFERAHPDYSGGFEDL